jgi:putative ABC transport system permease protein
VAVVNEAMVADVFQGRDPIGMRISGSGTEWEVVGVVADVRHGGLEQGAYPAFYTHIPQAPRARQSYVLRTDGDPLALLGPMRSVVQRIDPGVAIAEMLPLSGLTEEDTARPRFLSAVLSGFASLALLLACVGVYGVLAYIVRMRTTEMGLRAALGATGRGIVVHVLGSGLRPALVGLVLGLGASALLTRYLDSLLFGVEPADPLSFLVSAGLLGGAALAACAIPALAAARVTPAAALRSDA